MNAEDPEIKPDWKWGTFEGSRELDRILDRRMTFREKLEWLEETETLALFIEGERENGRAAATNREAGGSTAV